MMTSQHWIDLGMAARSAADLWVFVIAMIAVVFIASWSSE